MTSQPYPTGQSIHPLRQVWQWLSQPSKAITEIGARRQAQLLSAITLIYAFSTGMGTIATLSVNGSNQSSYVLAVDAICGLCAYLLSRTRYHIAGAGLLVASALVSAVATMMANPVNAVTALYAYIPLTLILASIFFSMWGLIVTTVICILIPVIMPYVIVMDNSSRLVGTAGILGTLGFLLVAAMIHRRGIEKERISVLQATNTELQSMRDTLEDRVGDRTHDLELAYEVGRTITEKIGNLSAVLAQATELIRSRFDLYYTQVYLTDPSGRNLVLRAGTGEVGQQLLRRGHRLEISAASLNGRAASEQQSVLVADTQKSGNFLPNPLLPSTRSELAIPLVVSGKVVGVLDMQSDKSETFNESNLPAYRLLAGQLAIAVQNAALLEAANQARLELEEQAARLASAGWHDYLNAVQRSEKIGFVYNQNEILPLVETQPRASENTLAMPIHIAGADIGEIQLAGTTDRQWTSAETDVVRATVENIARHIENLRLLAQAESYRVEAEEASQRLTREGWSDYLKARKQLASGYIYDRNEVLPLNGNHVHATADALSSPIIVREETIGQLQVSTAHGVDENAQEFVSAVALQLSDHIENLRLLEQAEQQRLEAESLSHKLETVATVSSTTATELDPEKLLDSVVNLTKESFDLYHAHIYLLDKDLDSLVLTAGAGVVGRTMVAEGRSIPRTQEHSLVARAAREGKAVVVNDVRNEPDFLSNPLLPETRSEMAIPMVVGDELMGVFDVQANVVDRFDEGDVRIQTTLAAQVSIALQNARLYVEQATTLKQLRELDRLKSSFLANMSHELRTPLNSILGFADVMLEGLDGPLTENMDNDLGLIHKNGQHLLHLINDVLDMAKIEAGRMNLHPEHFTIHEIVDEVTSITSTMASEKDIALFIEEGSDNELVVFADRTRMRQVLINLVNNSIKFTDKGKIAIKAQHKDDHVLISVSDTGVGIPPDKLEAIFQEFTQVDTSTTRKVGGTGLGLPISRRLVEMHGGRLWAESSGVDGEGATFFIDLPIDAVISPDQREI